MSIKDAVLEVVRNLPDEVSLEEILEEIEIHAAIRRGKDDIAQGRFVTHAEARKRLDQWLSK